MADVGHLLVEILPLALGAAVSPLVLISTMVTLALPTRPLAKAWLVTAGCAVALVAFELATLAIGSHLNAKPGSHPLEEAIVGFGLAGCLVALLVRSAVHRQPERSGGMMAHLDRAKTPSFFVVGIVLMATNVSTLVLVFPAMRIITHTHHGFETSLSAVIMITLFGLLPALAPTTLVSAMGSHGKAVLAPLNRFATDHTRAIAMAIEALFAVYFLVKGFRGALAL